MPTKSAPSEHQTSHATTRAARLYAHWLDGEWQRIAHPILVEGPAPYKTLQGVAEGALKLHALFGGELAISDVQQTDSGVLVRLFADEEFRRYLEHDRDFLTLVAEPAEGVSGVRRATATRGLVRAIGQYWTTSLPGVPTEVIRQLAEEVLSAEKITVIRWLRDQSTGPGRILKRYPKHQQLLEGVLWSVRHFTNVTGGPTDRPARAPRPYLEFLKEALNTPGGPGDYTTLEHVWDQLQALVPDESQRFARTAVLRALEQEQPDRRKWPPERHRIWNTIVHVWNSNVCDTLGAERTSIAKLPFAAAPFRGEVHDIAAPYASEGDYLRTKCPSLTFNPARLSWSTVLEAVRQGSTERARLKRAVAAGNRDEIEAVSAALIQKVMPVLAPEVHPYMPRWIWLTLSSLSALWPPASVVGIPLFIDDAQAFLRTKATKGLVLNTLRNAQKCLISTVTSTQDER